MANPPKKRPDSYIAYGVRKEPGGHVLVELKYKDGKIIKETLSEPDFRDITLEKFMRAVGIFWGLDE